jgi:Trk K+ transport system NAD-binding subunit
MGSIFLKNLEKHKEKVLVLDFDPDITHALSKQKIDSVYGDIGNSELLSQVPAKELKVVISTIPRKEDNLLMIRHFKNVSPHIFLMVSASRIDDALELYKEGADYVLLPMIVSAEQCVNMIKDLNKKEFYKLKKEHIKYLEDMHKFLY